MRSWHPARLRPDAVRSIRCRRAREQGAQREHGAEGHRLALGLPDSRVSSNHCRISRSADGWTLEDCGSKNGTRKNGEQVHGSAPLEDGDVIEIGRTFFSFAAPGLDPISWTV
jgi:predicted component of type VI protein secretion system